jgi:hypothetical protein
MPEDFAFSERKDIANVRSQPLSFLQLVGKQAILKIFFAPSIFFSRIAPIQDFNSAKSRSDLMYLVINLIERPLIFPTKPVC